MLSFATSTFILCLDIVGQSMWDTSFIVSHCCCPIDIVPKICPIAAVPFHSMGQLLPTKNLQKVIRLFRGLKKQIYENRKIIEAIRLHLFQYPINKAFRKIF